MAIKDIVAKFKEAKPSKGPDIRGKLNSARIYLNNLQSKYGRGVKNPDFKEAARELEEVLDSVTSVLFAIHDTEAKSYLTKSVISEIHQGIDSAKAGDAYGIEVSASRASTYLQGTIEYLNANPDGDEKKERLAHIMAFIMPYSERDGTSERNFDQAVKLCKEIADSEKAKAKAWFTELADALEKVSEAKKDLRSAAAFANKMLPKVR